jgi:predicted dehydrogenase
MRYVPCYVKARERVLGGAIGIPFIAEAAYVHDMRERATRYDSWQIDVDYPQQVVLGASSHTLDLVRWILDSEVTEVFSYATHLGWPEYPDYDTVLTLLRFGNGAVASVMSTSPRREDSSTL